jgi:hypothetical protein
MDSDDISPSNLFDRRIATRYKQVFPVGLEVGFKEFCKCRSINVSSTGIRLVVDRALGSGTPTNLTLCLDEENLVELQGETVWQQSLGSMGTHVIGFAFHPGQTESEKKLAQWLEAHGTAA